MVLRNAKALLLLSLLALAAPLAAQSAVAAPKKAKAKARPKTATSAPAREDAAGESVEEYLQKLSTIPDVVNRKDPFIQASAPFAVPRELLSDGVDLSLPVLERYPITKYSIVATLLGDQYPRALLRLPNEEKGKVLIVREKDKLGNKGGTITKILKDGVMVVQRVRSPLGFIDRQETVIRVGGNDEPKPAERPEEIRQGQPAPGAAPIFNGNQVPRNGGR